MKLFYWIAKIGNVIALIAWLIIWFVIWLPLSLVFLSKVRFSYDKVTGRTNLTWKEFLSIVGADGWFGRLSMPFLKIGIHAIGDLFDDDIMEEYIHIPV